MPSFSEVYTWTLQEVVEETRLLLPEGWRLMRSCPNIYVGRILNADDEVVWEDAQLEERLMLLNAYGWALARTNPMIASFLWQRKDAPVGPVRAGSQPLPGVTFADPEDIDPAAIAAVYEAEKQE